jgi:uncharacterized protein (TIGR02611 family)
MFRVLLGGEFQMEKLKAFLSRLPHPLRWALTMIVGVILLILGVIMLVTPGPGLVFLFLGFSVLALELEWAREINRQGLQGLEKILIRVKAIFKKK